MSKALAGMVLGGLVMTLAGCGAAAPAAPVAVPALDQQVGKQALFSRSVTKMTTDIFLAYDHNKNGQIELERPTGNSFWQRLGNRLFWRDERVRSVTSTYTLNDELTLTTRVYTRFPLFFAADRDGDKRVTFEELRHFIATQYDLNEDGTLQARGITFWRPKNEIERFNADFGEHLMTYREVDLRIGASGH